jgi:tRNA-guanine family transglycosylase
VSLYYCAVTKNDWIKYGAKSMPFWMFLDEHPDGFLISLAYHTPFLPNHPMFFDCGAWSYKDKSIPKMGKDIVTAKWAYDMYCQYARDNDIIIAPDHMLIPQYGEYAERRLFNLKSATEFRALTRTSPYFPMAVVHGENTDERCEIARNYINMGYEGLAIGGLAGISSKKTIVLDAVRTLKTEFPDIKFHVLGLSSPKYAKEWYDLGIYSFDGSSHFKQAFMCGLYFMAEGESLKSYKASRVGEEITAPLCDCRACAMLRIKNVDTRSYGSNATNMGRAAHNLNHLIKVHSTIKQNLHI